MLAVAGWAGRFVRQLHALPLDEAQTERPLRYFADVIRERRRDISKILLDGDVLPRHLAEQANDWMPSPEELGLTERPALLHADLHDGHVFIRRDRAGWQPTGVIDLNRARLGHRLYELGPVWRWLLGGDPRLMAAFLTGAEFPEREKPGFPRIALTWCLLHQGVLQYKVDTPDIEKVGSLDELAEHTFGWSQ